MIFGIADLTQINGSEAGLVYSRVSASRGGFGFMDQSDFEYYRARIAEEEIAAQQATHPLAAESHRKLAEEYASLIVANDSYVSVTAQA